MDTINSTISKSVARLNCDGGTKRKFTPNISKALSKKTISDAAKPLNTLHKPKDKHDSTKGKNRGRINRKALEEDTPRFVQSYSIFEKGIGCVVKNDSHSVEMHAVGSSASKTSVRELQATEIKADPNLLSESFITNIEQCFKHPPTFMKEPSTKPEPSDEEMLPSCSSSTTPPKLHRASTTPTQLFDGTSPMGTLFTLKLPETLFTDDSPIIKEGKFAKIQLLDNGETLLVISDSVFRLACPRPTPYSSDVVLVEEQKDGIVDLNSLGHLDQCVTAVPDLDRFVNLGQ